MRAFRILLRRINDVLARQGDSPPPADPEPWHWYSIANGVEVFEHQFSAELKKTAAYAVPERGIFKTEGLVDTADNHIHETVRDMMPRFARAEFQAAGRCLAFGLYSASGFHSARAVESVLRQYHRNFLPAQNSDAQTMGQMASALDDMHSAKKRAKNLPRQNTIRHLRDFTNFDRNPLIHKTVVLEELDALTLFNAAASVIVEMAKELVEERAPDPVVARPVMAMDETIASSGKRAADAPEEQPS